MLNYSLEIWIGSHHNFFLLTFSLISLYNQYFIFYHDVPMDDVVIIDAKMPEEVWVKGGSESDSQVNQVLDSILCDD